LAYISFEVTKAENLDGNNASKGLIHL
jgi:hypothetical protein